MNSSEPVGTVRALWRFPVKSMLGEQLDVVEVGDGGMTGDRGYAVRDRETGKVASAKHPKLWPGLLRCRAAFVEPPRPRHELPPVRIDLADGESVLSDASDTDAILSRFFGRDVELARAAQSGYTIDQYHPDEENYDPTDTGTRSSKRGSALRSSPSTGCNPPCPTGRLSTCSPSVSSRCRPSSSSASSSRRAASTPADSE